MEWKELGTDHNSSLLLKLSPNSELLVNQFDNATQKTETNLKTFFV